MPYLKTVSNAACSMFHALSSNNMTFAYFWREETILTDHILEIQRRTAANQDLTVPAPMLVGRFAYDLSTDQPTAALPHDVLDSVEAELRSGQTHYVDVSGLGTLRELLADQLRAKQWANVAADGVIVTAGVQEARFLAIQVLSETYTSVAVPNVVHPGVRNALGVRAPREVMQMETSRELGHLVPVSEIERALVAGGQLLVLESPVRLTGAVYGDADVRRIAELVSDHDAHVVWDAGFAPWANPPPSSLAMESTAQGRATLIGEPVAGAGLEAWSLGFAASQPEHVAGFTKLKQVMSICTSTPTQLAAIELLKRGSDQFEAMRERLAAVRRHLVEAITAAGASVLPGACAHVLTFEHQDSEVFVGAADGAMFGAPGVVRLRVDGDAAAAVVLASGLQATGRG